MLFKRYNIVIFRDREGELRSLRLRGWCFFLLFLIILALSLSTAYFWNFYSRSLNLEQQLQDSRRTVQAQNSQLVSMAGNLQKLQRDLRRVQVFDSKLRVMMNVDREVAGVMDEQEEALEEAEMEAFQGTESFLPLHRQDLLTRRMHRLADQLAEDSSMEEVTQQDLLLLLRDNRELLASTPSIWPVEGYLSSRFGNRASPITGERSRHQGLDIANPSGTPIIAPAKGEVTFAAWDGAYGNSVIISHGNNLTTRYAHMQKFAVEKGDEVNRGDIIGYVGNTGRSTGPHLHYEVRIGEVSVDPMRYILN